MPPGSLEGTKVDGISTGGLKAPEVPWPRPSAEPLPSVNSTETTAADKPTSVPIETGINPQPGNEEPTHPNIAQEATRDATPQPPVDSLSVQTGNIAKKEPHNIEGELASKNIESSPQPAAVPEVISPGETQTEDETEGRVDEILRIASDLQLALDKFSQAMREIVEEQKRTRRSFGRESEHDNSGSNRPTDNIAAPPEADMKSG